VAVEITEVRIKLVASKGDKLRGFCSITLDDCFVIRDLKIIEGGKGPFVAMPSRKLMERCPRCGGKNHHRASFCNDCGARLSSSAPPEDPGVRQKLHADIAHPINSGCRELIQRRVLDEYGLELDRAKDPNYQPAALDVFEEESLAEAAPVGDAAFDRGPGNVAFLDAERDGRGPPGEPAPAGDVELVARHLHPSDLPAAADAFVPGPRRNDRAGGPQRVEDGRRGRGGGRQDAPFADRRGQGRRGQGPRQEPRGAGQRGRGSGGFHGRAAEPREADARAYPGRAPPFASLFAPAPPAAGAFPEQAARESTPVAGAPARHAAASRADDDASRVRTPDRAPRPPAEPEPEDNFGVGLFS
jgi:stage V sporulation protein G